MRKRYATGDLSSSHEGNGRRNSRIPGSAIGERGSVLRIEGDHSAGGLYPPS